MKRIPIISTLTARLSGRASINFDYPRTASHALSDTAATQLGKQLRDTTAGRPAGHAGFFVLSDGIDALTTRWILAQRAQKSIDAQYYQIENDIVGKEFIRVLLEAADRGVRVRLLLDDIFTKGYDTGMAALDSHPNFEIRIFNPFKRGVAGRTFAAATDFARINRRMHNKSFTVDNQITVIGGRNIADEYYGAREDAKLGDLDVIGVGPVVADVSATFDRYWNHETALPVGAFARAPEDPRAALGRVRTNLDAAREQIADSVYSDAIRARVLRFLDTDLSFFHWVPYKFVYDSPDKGVGTRSEAVVSIAMPLVDVLRNARQEVIVVSPYFVPMKSGIYGFSELRARGVEVTIITNSLAANNQFSVHSGYAPCRKPLLKNGVKIFEVRPDADIAGAELVAATGAKATLHTKAFVVDREHVFIGSFNFDPRSVSINTEHGVIIHDAEFGEVFARWARKALPAKTYEVFLNRNGKLRWRGLENGRDAIYEREPQTSWGQRFAAGLMRCVPIRSQL